MKNREVVITGVAGFIGSNMAEKLVMENRVYGIDNLSWGKKENLESLFKNQNFKFINMDVKNTEQLAREIEGKGHNNTFECQPRCKKKCRRLPDRFQ